MKKPVIRSPLDRLPLEQKRQLAAWLSTGGKDGIGITYKAAKARLMSEFAVKAGIDALHRFYRRQNRIGAKQSPRIESMFDSAANSLTIVIHFSR